MKKVLLAVVLSVYASLAMAQDHSHKAFDALLKKHVVLINQGKTSQVRYAEFAKDAPALKAYTESLSAVTKAQFDGFSKPQQMAFLINAYNAFTIDLILQNYPVKSIKDIGSDLFDNRWKRKFFNLLGQPTSLDSVEHEMLRAPGRYDEPRVHFAVNCASVGCPMLREEAFVADRLDKQLEEQTVRFLSDHSRNRYNKDKSILEVSKIFDWFKKDWTSGYKGIGSAGATTSREQFFGRYAAQITDDEKGLSAIKDGKAGIDFLPYDWGINDAKAK